MEQEETKLNGIVERVIYRNTDNGWTVLELETDSEYCKAVGTLVGVEAGEQLELTGEWIEHPKFGRQFRASAYKHRRLDDTESQFRYLASGAIKGVGPATAAAIIEKFGADSLRVIEQEPERLAKVRGITPERAERISHEYLKQAGMREVMLSFAAYGLTQTEALRCWKRWGDQAAETLKNNPYRLCSPGLYISFERADRISMGLDRPADDPRRVEAGLIHVLRHNEGNGHTCLPKEKLTAATAQMLGIPLSSVEESLQLALDGFVLREERLRDKTFIFLPDLYRAERYIAARVRRIAELNRGHAILNESGLERIEAQNGLKYQEQQRRAIAAAVEQGVLILTGGPGTGKTTTLRAIITLLESSGDTVEITAPTGRAAKRITELTGTEARTIHRLLEAQWDEDDMPVFNRNEENPLECDTLIVDEVSMVDTVLFESLLRALRPGCRLVLVGDSHQLPAVGPGSILNDLMENGQLPTVELTEVFRQALESDIVANAHRIVGGELPVPSDKTGDFFFLPQATVEDTAAATVDLCTRRLPAGYGTSVLNGIQVLCPGHKGDIGTARLNSLLQEAVNPADAHKKEWTGEGNCLREGDKVMHIRNDYDIVWTRDDGTVGSGVFNGDIGILEKILPRELQLHVRYDDRVAVYSWDQAKELEPAYAVTVHKSQGSEFDTVVIPLFRNTPLLCYRNLLYTAVTRAKRLLVLVGSWETLKSMVENDRKTLRYTGLGYFLSHEKPGGMV